MTPPDVLVRDAAHGDQPSPAGPGPADHSSSPEAGRARTPRPAGAGLRVSGAALCILAALLLGFVADAGLLGNLRHARDRQVDYAALRGALANGVAPVGPTGEHGEPLPLGTPVALLEIPGVHLREVVGEGTASAALARGPGHRRDTVLPGQTGVSVIMGRQATDGGPFQHLGDLRPGQALTVTTGQGKNTFRVIGVRRSGDAQPPALKPGRSRLTLVTADGTPFMPRGILRVDADLVSSVRPAPAPVIAPGALPEEEKPMAVQKSAWLPLVLWGQGLVLAAGALAWASARWGRRHAWVVGIPLVGSLGLAAADQALLLLPNLL